MGFQYGTAVRYLIYITRHFASNVDRANRHHEREYVRGRLQLPEPRLEGTASAPKHCYNANASSSYYPNGESISIWYGMGRMRGYLASDDVRFGGTLLAANQSFAVGTYPDRDFAASPVEGVLGPAPAVGYNDFMGPSLTS
ncbi:Peptidase A1 [Aphelenchoides avenae]|nr:Peptidase A1 [Aphelenchus avenae]